jgi:predicted nuclease of predicted toxin-antitoxin system
MKLLFDQNLSHRLVDRLDDLYPQSTHVRDVELQRATDQEVWEFAEEEGYTIVTKDSDFNEMLVVWGSPPDVIWLRLGNCTTDAIERAIRNNADALEELAQSEETGLFEIE